MNIIIWGGKKTGGVFWLECGHNDIESLIQSI